MNPYAVHRLSTSIRAAVRLRALWVSCIAWLLVLPSCAEHANPPVVFGGVAPSRTAVILSLRRFEVHFNRSIFATLRMHGHRINLVGQWITKPPPHFKFVALTELGTLAVELQRVKGRIVINHVAAEFPKRLARALGNDLYVALAAPAAAVHATHAISLHRHDAQVRVSNSGQWHGTLYFAATAGHLRLAQLTSRRGLVTIRYSHYHKGFDPGRLTILDADHGLELTLDFTGNVP